MNGIQDKKEEVTTTGSLQFYVCGYSHEDNLGLNGEKRLAGRWMDE